MHVGKGDKFLICVSQLTSLRAISSSDIYICVLDWYLGLQLRTGPKLVLQICNPIYIIVFILHFHYTYIYLTVILVNDLSHHFNNLAFYFEKSKLNEKSIIGAQYVLDNLNILQHRTSSPALSTTGLGIILQKSQQLMDTSS